MSETEILTRIAVLETEVKYIKEDVREVKEAVNWIREHMANAVEVERLSKRVNGLTRDVAENRGVREYVKVILQWALQSGVVAGLVYFAVRFSG